MPNTYQHKNVLWLAAVAFLGCFSPGSPTHTEAKKQENVLVPVAVVSPTSAAVVEALPSPGSALSVAEPTSVATKEEPNNKTPTVKEPTPQAKKKAKKKEPKFPIDCPPGAFCCLEL